MRQVVVFRPKSNLVWGWFALILDGLYFVQSVLYPSRGGNVFVDAAVAATIAAAATTLWLRPKLILRENDLIVVNPIRTIAIAYRDITDLETKWALLIKHNGGNTRVWVAPANGKRRWIGATAHRWSSNHLPRNSASERELVPVSASVDSDSGVAARLIQERLRFLH